MSKHRLTLMIGLILIFMVAGFFILQQPNFLSAQINNSNNSKFKNFSENRFGLSLDYPQNWAFDIGYDRYAPGLMDIALVDKKCASACPADCIDIRIFAGAKPTNTSNQLFIQLYENAIAVKDTNNPDLVQKLLLVIKPSIKF